MNENRLKEYFVRGGLYQHLRPSIEVAIPGVKPVHHKPMMRQFKLSNGKSFMYKSESECWHNAGLESLRQKLPIQFKGYGIALNLHIYDNYIVPEQMHLLYWSQSECGSNDELYDKFYIVYFEDLEKWDANRGVTDAGEPVLIFPITALKRLNIPELKTRCGL